MRDYLFFAGKSTDDFNVYITDAGVYEKPDRNYEKIPVPGRNGDLIIENDKYENKPQNYPAVIMENFDENFDALTAFLLTQKGYQRLSDTFHPDIFYLATFDGIDKLKQTLEPKAGSFVLKFNRKPQRFLVSGEKKTTFTNSGEIKNPTLFDALPLIFVIGIGILEIGNVSVKILNAPGGVYTGIYIDSDLQEAYVGDLNCNGMIELVDGKFPVLNGGINEIKLYGFDYKQNTIPTLSNYPAVNWTTDAMKREHIGDTYLRTSNNKVYKFEEITGVIIKFSDQCDTEKSCDGITLYYVKNGQWYSLGMLSGRAGQSTNNLAGRRVYIPTTEFYMMWKTDGSVSGFWGYAVDSVVYGDGENEFTSRSDPGISTYTNIVVGTDDLPHSDHPYTQDSVTEYYKFTMPGTGDTYTWEEGSWDDIKENGATLQSADIIPRWWKL